MVNKYITLIKKDLLIEFRNSFSISSVLLYVFATVYIIYTTFFNFQRKEWNTLFWVVFLFISVNALIRTFNQEHGNRNLYYYQLVSATQIYTTKLIYNTFILFTLSLIEYIFFIIFAGNMVRDLSLFFLCLALASIGFSAVFTFVAAIGSKSGNNQLMTAILGFPCIIPILLVLLKISANALGLMQDTDLTSDILILVSIDVILIGISLLLFPYLWRE